MYFLPIYRPPFSLTFQYTVQNWAPEEYAESISEAEKWAPRDAQSTTQS
jgi:hypothetical protein